MEKICTGWTTGRIPCVIKPVWAIFDTHHTGKADRYSCERHLHLAISERGALVKKISGDN